MTTIPFFFNQCLDKKRLKRLILWSLSFQDEHKTLQMIEDLKNVGFRYATAAGVSLSIDDLRIPPKKRIEVLETQALILQSVQGRSQGHRTAIEEIQTVVDTWHRTSETVKDHVIDFFEATNILNPVYMMAFSGARGNVSQVRQLVGMRGLMADPKGDIIGYAIRSNFREGLTMTEYMISAYGARKGVVDTALRTADAGYLTRRLVDVAQHILVQQGSCGTRRGIRLRPIRDGRRIVLKIQDRLIGRVLAKDLHIRGHKIASRNAVIDHELADEIINAPGVATGPRPEKEGVAIFVRSPLTCDLDQGVCQLCYGWSFTQNRLVTIGDAVGVIAGQSIGEPGTQLTMRTFHTGGVFTGEVQDQFRAPHGGTIHYPTPLPGVLIRTPYGQIAFLVKKAGNLVIRDDGGKDETTLYLPSHTALFLREGEAVQTNQILALPGDHNGRETNKVQTRKIIFSEFDGEVHYGRMLLKWTQFPETRAEKNRREKRLKQKRLFLNDQAAEFHRAKKKYTLTASLGTVWILAGRRLNHSSQMLSIFEGSGQLVDMDTVFSRHATFGRTEGFVTRTKSPPGHGSGQSQRLAMRLPAVPATHQLSQPLEDTALVKMIEPLETLSAYEALMNQPRIYTPYAKVRFDLLQNNLAIGGKNGDIFVIPDYTQQVQPEGTPFQVGRRAFSPIASHLLRYTSQRATQGATQGATPRFREVGHGRQNSFAVFYYKSDHQRKKTGAFLWKQALFADRRRRRGVMFLLDYTFYESGHDGLDLTAIGQAWGTRGMAPGAPLTQLMLQGGVRAFPVPPKGAFEEGPVRALSESLSTRTSEGGLQRSPLKKVVDGVPSFGAQPSTGPLVHNSRLVWCQEGETFYVQPNLQGQGYRRQAAQAGLVLLTTTPVARTITPVLKVARPETRQCNPREKDRDRLGYATDPAYTTIRGVGVDTAFPFEKEPQSRQKTLVEHTPGWIYLPDEVTMRAGPRYGNHRDARPQFEGSRVTSKPILMPMESKTPAACFDEQVEVRGRLYQKVIGNLHRQALPPIDDDAPVHRSRLHDIRLVFALRHPRLIRAFKALSVPDGAQALCTAAVHTAVVNCVVISHPRNPWYPIFGINMPGQDLRSHALRPSGALSVPSGAQQPMKPRANAKQSQASQVAKRRRRKQPETSRSRVAPHSFGYLYYPLMTSVVNHAISRPTGCCSKKRTHLRTMALVYQPMTEFSMDRLSKTVIAEDHTFELGAIWTHQTIPAPLRRPELSDGTSLYAAFPTRPSEMEPCAFATSSRPRMRLKKSAAKTFWIKQFVDRFARTPQEPRVAMTPLLLPNRSYINQSAFICRFLLEFQAPTETETFGAWTLGWTPPWTTIDSATETTATLGFVKRPRYHRREDEIFHPPATWLHFGESFLRHQKRIGSKGEVFRTFDNQSFVLDEKDTQTFAFGPTQSRALSVPWTESRPTRTSGAQLSRPSQTPVSIGAILRFGDEIQPGVGTPIPGQVIALTPTTVTIRRGQPVLFYESGAIHVKQHQYIFQGHPIVTLSYQRLVTGDIVQGIPKIEQLFEGSQARDSVTGRKLSGLLVQKFRSLRAREKRAKLRKFQQMNPEKEKTIRKLRRQINMIAGPIRPRYRKYHKRYGFVTKRLLSMVPKLTGYFIGYLKWKKLPQLRWKYEKLVEAKEREVDLIQLATKERLDSMRLMIQQKIIENIQRVYLAQGVSISDIHFEIIVRRITTWGRIRLSGSSGLFRHEIIPLHRIEKVNASTERKKAVFIPLILGISASALNSESFLSAASFQETSRVLTRDAIDGKIDFLRGVKERVILGDLIPAGTGNAEQLAYRPVPSAFLNRQRAF